MKGANAGVEFVAKILISVCIVGIIIIVLFTLLPSVTAFGCKQKQYDAINDIISSATAARSTTDIKEFKVESCVETISFDCQLGSGENADACYNIKFKGDNEINVPLDIDATVLAVNGGDVLTPGEYVVRIEPYEINFEKRMVSRENG